MNGIQLFNVISTDVIWVKIILIIFYLFFSAQDNTHCIVKKQICKNISAMYS